MVSILVIYSKLIILALYLVFEVCEMVFLFFNIYLFHVFEITFIGYPDKEFYDTFGEYLNKEYLMSDEM